MKRYLFPILLITALLISPRTTTALAAEAHQMPQEDPPARPRYTVTDLGVLGGDTSQAFGINDIGQVVGLTKVNIATPEGNPYHAFIWASGVMTDLGTLGAYMSIAFDINDAGQVAGWSHTATGNGGFVWQDGAMQALSTLGGSDRAAYAINKSGLVVGYADIVDNSDPEDPVELHHAALWENGAVRDLGTFGGTESGANDINDAGQVVGKFSYVERGISYSRAFLLQGNNVMQGLGTLGGDKSAAWAVNNAGEVVGLAEVPGGKWHAFLWRNGTMQDLGTLGGNESYAYDINENGQVIGRSLTATQGYRAFLWVNNQMKDLNTLIPVDSGWTLVSAEGINQRGQIVGWGTHNGQTHAYLLTPKAYYWDNAAGGSWHVAANWDPQGIPGEGDTTIFELAGEYTVDAAHTSSAAGLTANQLSADRLVVTATATVNFDNLDLNLIYDSPEEPSLMVNGGGTANVNSGATTFSHAVVGGQDPVDPDNPPTARLQVFNEGTSLTGSGRLTIGDEGAGDLFVANGAHLTSAEARLGGTRPGTAVVGGDGSLWETGSIAVGYGVTGTLTIENGSRVDSNDAYVGFGSESADSQVTIEGAAPGGTESLWTVAQNLTIGEGAPAEVAVRRGAQLAVNQNLLIKQGLLSVKETTTGGDGSSLYVLGDVTVGGSPDHAGILTLDHVAIAEIGGDLVIGRNGQAGIIVAADPAVGPPASFDTTDPARGLCQFGDTHAALASISGLMYCRIVSLGSAVSSDGLGEVEVSGTLLAREFLRVGQPGGGASAVVNMRPGFFYGSRLVGLQGVYIGPTGTVSGTGIIEAGGIGLLVDGRLLPAIRVMPAAQVHGADRPPAASTTFAISGTLTLSPTGRLEIPVTGAAPGLYGSLAVTGTAALDGVLALDFDDGFVPQTGDAFTFLTASGGVSGDFDSVEVNGLPPGFEYALTFVDGQAVLEVRDGGAQSPQTVMLPLLRR